MASLRKFSLPAAEVEHCPARASASAPGRHGCRNHRTPPVFLRRAKSAKSGSRVSGISASAILSNKRRARRVCRASRGRRGPAARAARAWLRPGLQQLGPERRAVGGDELAGKPRRRGDGNLLAEDGAHGKLEAVPGARHAEAGPRGDQRRHHRVFGELGADGERIGGEIEDPSEACQVPNEPAPSRVDEVKASLGR